MALNPGQLGQEIFIALQTAQGGTSPDALRTMCDQIAQAVYNYLIQAQISTTVSGTTNGGTNASFIIPPPAGPTPVPGPITAPSTVTGTGTGNVF